jgi:hypothetical protein
MVQLSATRCRCITILLVSLMNFADMTFCVASQRVFIVVSVYFVMTQSGNFWIHPRMQLSISFSKEFVPTETQGQVWETGVDIFFELGTPSAISRKVQ